MENIQDLKKWNIFLPIKDLGESGSVINCVDPHPSVLQKALTPEMFRSQRLKSAIPGSTLSAENSTRRSSG